MITLGLGEVLLNATTGEIYTPNTNTLVKMGASGAQGTLPLPTNEAQQSEK